MVSKTLKSWSGFQSKVIDPYWRKEKDKRPELWFRGQSNASWPLQTTLERFRTFTLDTDRTSFYSKLMDAFREGIVGFEPRGDVSEGDALDLLARHHGLPSMLLDWTRSPYVAAFFAFEGALRNGKSAITIWVCNRQSINVDEEVDLLEDREQLWYNRRALEQAGVFMRINTVSKSVEGLLGDALTKYEIPSEDAKAVMRHQEAMNITASTLFRDYDGAARAAIVRVST
jgi:hypothetical protein